MVRILLFTASAAVLFRFYRSRKKRGDSGELKFPVRKIDIAVPAAGVLFTAVYDVVILYNSSAGAETAAVLGTLKLYIVDIALLVFTLSRVILQLKQKRKEKIRK